MQHAVEVGAGNNARGFFSIDAELVGLVAYT
jgi:hypothetical protein